MTFCICAVRLSRLGLFSTRTVHVNTNIYTSLPRFHSRWFWWDVRQQEELSYSTVMDKCERLNNYGGRKVIFTTIILEHMVVEAKAGFVRQDQTGCICCTSCSDSVDILRLSVKSPDLNMQISEDQEGGQKHQSSSPVGGTLMALTRAEFILQKDRFWIFFSCRLLSDDMTQPNIHLTQKWEKLMLEKNI